MTTTREKVTHVLNAKQTRDHACHWPGCTRQVPPAMWGCAQHWYRIPRVLRNQLWRAYEPGQEETMTPSASYMQAARAIQHWIATHA